MENPYLVYLAMILLLGTLVSALASKLKISNVFFLVFVGMVIGSMGIMNFPEETLLIISSLAVVVVVFEHSAKLRFAEITRYSGYGTKLVLLFFVLSVTILTWLTVSLFDLNSSRYLSIVLAASFSCLVFSSEPGLTVVDTKARHSKIRSLMETEELLTKPLTLIAPLLLLNHLGGTGGGNDVIMLLSQIGLGAALGVAAGFFIHIVLNQKLTDELAYLVVLSCSVVTFLVAEKVGAGGILSLTVLGLVFGNFHIRHKAELEKYTSVVSYIFNILVFFLIGTSMLIEFKYIARGTFLFLIYLLVRFLSINVALRGLGLSHKQRFYLTVNVPKGIDTAIIILLMMVQFARITGMETVINLSLLFSLYSLVLANVAGLFKEQLTA